MSIPKIFPDPYLRKGVTLACVFLFPPRPLPHCFLYWPRVQLSPQHTLGRKAHQKSPATQASVTLVLVEFYSETYMKDTQTCLWKGEVELLYNLFLFTKIVARKKQNGPSFLNCFFFSPFGKFTLIRKRVQGRDIWSLIRPSSWVNCKLIYMKSNILLVIVTKVNSLLGRRLWVWLLVSVFDRFPCYGEFNKGSNDRQGTTLGVH